MIEVEFRTCVKEMCDILLSENSYKLDLTTKKTNLPLVYVELSRVHGRNIDCEEFQSSRVSDCENQGNQIMLRNFHRCTTYSFIVLVTQDSPRASFHDK